MVTADHLTAALAQLAAVLDGRPAALRSLAALWRVRGRLLEAADALALLAEDLDAT